MKKFFIGSAILVAILMAIGTSVSASGTSVSAFDDNVNVSSMSENAQCWRDCRVGHSEAYCRGYCG